MTTAQKIIKYLAMAFAVFLIITIISSILSGIYALSEVLGLKKDKEEVIENMSVISFENTDISTLDIDMAYTNLIIKTGETLYVETNSTNIESKADNKSLKIKDKSHNWFSNYDNQELIVYIPEDLEFEKVKITAGAAKIDIVNLNTKTLDFKLGAGEAVINNLNVSKNTDIEGGAGKLDILSGKINDLDLEMGVGEINLAVSVLGKSDIEAGIGKLNIDLKDGNESYKIKTNKGIGSIRIDGKEVSNGEVYGEGENYIEVDGGIGSITIDFE